MRQGIEVAIKLLVPARTILVEFPRSAPREIFRDVPRRAAGGVTDLLKEFEIPADPLVPGELNNPPPDLHSKLIDIEVVTRFRAKHAGQGAVRMPRQFAEESHWIGRKDRRNEREGGNFCHRSPEPSESRTSRTLEP